MRKTISTAAIVTTFGTISMLCTTASAQIHLVTDDVRRDQLHAESNVERMLMVPMRDGVRLSTRVYLPKDADGPVPAIFWRTPYNYSERNKGNPKRPSAYLKFALDAVRNGYAFVMQNERGKYFSEGEWEILGFPRTDGYDALTWIADQEWSTGKVATLGCSSTAEWQPALAAMNHPAHAANVPMAFGAGIGKMGEYWEQGNFYRGGAMQYDMITWMFGNQNTQRPTLPADLSREDRMRIARYTDLEASAPGPDWDKAVWHLPVSDLYSAYGGPTGAFNDMGNMTPGDPAWSKGGLYNEGEEYHVPSLWVGSWYDLSTAPNLETFNYVRRTAAKDVADSQYMIVAPTGHCTMYRLYDPMVVGDRNFGDVSFGLDDTLWSFLDRYVKGEKNGFAKKQPKVQYFEMGTDEWQESEVWPPKGATPVTYYLDSERGANTLQGDGELTTDMPDGGVDSFIYDPANPVPSMGGNLWNANSGAYDNRAVEARQDVLVYSTPVLTEPLNVTGKIKIKLYVSSDAKDTDFTVKLLDVFPDGTAYNLDETIQRARYRDGYDKQVMMEEGEIYELDVSSITTSNVFLPGHQLRIEVSSSNFPNFERNLNTGRNNFTETEIVVANNVVHHSAEHPSYIVLPIVKKD